MIVKEYYTEGSGSIQIIYEASSPDPVSSDVLASCYLQTVLSFAERGWVIGLTVLDRGVKYHFSELHPSFAVSVALRHILDTRMAEVTSYFDVLDPAYNTLLKRVLGGILPESKSNLAALKEELYDSRYRAVLYVTALAVNPVPLMELSYTANVNRTRFVVLEPCTPWRYTGLEDAYKVWQHYDKVNKGLARMGVPVAINVAEAQNRLAEIAAMYQF